MSVLTKTAETAGFQANRSDAKSVASTSKVFVSPSARAVIADAASAPIYPWADRVVCDPATDRDAWLAARRRFLTGSDVGIVLGRAPKWLAELVDTLDIIADKEGRGEPRKETQRMRLGKHLEPFARAEAKLQFGWSVEPYAALVRDPVCEYLAATLDGLLYTPWGLATVEQKVVSAWPKTWERDGVPDHYQLQAQTQMGVTGAMHAVILAYHLAPAEDQHGLRAYYVPRDEDEIEGIRDAANDLFTRYVKAPAA